MQKHVGKTGMMLSAPPSSPEFGKALRAAKAALESGADLYFYAIDAAVEGLDDPRFLSLKESGAKLFACAYSLQQRGLTPKVDATLAGLTVLSDIMASTEEFQSFN